MPGESKIIVVFDNNTYISACISRNFRRKLYKIITDKRFRIIYCQELYDEFNEVIIRDKFRKHITLHQAQRFLTLVIERLKIVNITTFIRLSRDDADNYLLSLAFDSNAKFIVPEITTCLH